MGLKSIEVPLWLHIFFMDNFLLLICVFAPQWDGIRKILNTYELALGQSLNLQMFEAFFICNVNLSAKPNILTIIGVNER